ncbi:MAG TPA: hypothetical protein PLV45_16200, partial [bacterium]|nr:hypothetical protein [bacterium]
AGRRPSRPAVTGRGQAELDGLGASDPRTAMSRGTGDARAEVTFQNSGVRYRATWSVHRAYNKPGGSIQAAQRCVINETEDRVLADRIRDCDLEIRRITGLDYAQFTRSVILAQGDFAAFLEADSGSRGALLESITGLDIYRRLSRAAHEKGADIQREIAAIENQMQHVASPDADAMAALEAQVNELNAERAALDTQRERHRIQREWYGELNQRDTAYRRAEEAGIRAKQVWEESEPRREILERAERAWRIRAEMDRLDRARQTVSGLSKQIPGVDAELKKVTESLQSAQAEKNAAQVDLQAAQAERTRMQPDLQRAAALDVRIAEVQKRMEPLRARLKELRKKETRGASELEKLRKRLDVDAAECDGLRQWIDERKGMETLTENRAFVCAGVEEVLKLQEKIRQAEHDIEKNERQRSAAERRLHELQNNRGDFLKKDAELQASLATFQAQQLRGQLAPGEPCPVCGATDHPYAETDDIRPGGPALESAAETAFQEILTARKELVQRLESLDTRIRATEQNLAALAESETHMKQRRAEFTEVREERLRALDPYLSQRSAVWEAELAQTGEQFLTEMKDAIESYRQRCDALKALNAATEDRRAKIRELEYHAAGIVENIGDCGSELAELQVALETLETERSALLDGRSTGAVRDALDSAVAVAEQRRDAAAQRCMELTVQAETLNERLA